MIFPPLANFFGFLSLFSYVLTLTPTLVRILLPAWRRHKINIFLTKYRRQVGVLSWFLGFIHGTLIVFDRQLNLLDPKVAIVYFQGLALITILTLLAITSNDWSVKKLKKGWNKLHKLTYLVLIFLPWHILDKTWGEWTILTPFGLFLIFLFAAFSLLRFVKKK